MITVPEFKKRKAKGARISMITCYDASFAKILAASPIDVLLIGDSSAMVMQGFDSTIHATAASIEYHVAAVARGAPGKFIVADMPFLSTRKSRDEGMSVADRFLKAGAHAVKIEGIKGNEDLVNHLVESGIPVMGHLGFTPQSEHQLGRRVQGRRADDARGD